MAELKDEIKVYQQLLEKKDELAEQTKANNKEIKDMEFKIANQMIDEEVPGMTVGTYTYSLSQTIRYSKKSEEALAEAGVEFFEVLREQGLGEIIVERVDPRTLQSTMKAIVEENNGELNEELAEVINSYEELGVSRRKATSKALARAKENMEA